MMDRPDTRGGEMSPQTQPCAEDRANVGTADKPEPGKLETAPGGIPFERWWDLGGRDIATKAMQRDGTFGATEVGYHGGLLAGGIEAARHDCRTVAAVRTLEALRYTYLDGAEMWKPPRGKRPAWLDFDGAVDEKALATAREIALMWGRDRSQFVSRIQVAVRGAMDWMRRSMPSAAPNEHGTDVDDLAFAQSFDAVEWAQAFERIVLDKGVTIDSDLMLAWFSSSLMRGWDEREQRAQNDGARSLLDAVAGMPAAAPQAEPTSQLSTETVDNSVERMASPTAEHPPGEPT